MEKNFSEKGILKRVIWIALQIPDAMREEATISKESAIFRKPGFYVLYVRSDLQFAYGVPERPKLAAKIVGGAMFTSVSCGTTILI